MVLKSVGTGQSQSGVQFSMSKRTLGPQQVAECGREWEAVHDLSTFHFPHPYEGEKLLPRVLRIWWDNIRGESVDPWPAAAAAVGGSVIIASARIIWAAGGLHLGGKP